MWSSHGVLVPSYPVASSQPPLESLAHFLAPKEPAFQGILSHSTTTTTTTTQDPLLHEFRTLSVICISLRLTFESGPMLVVLHL